MKAFSKVSKLNVMLRAVLLCLIVAGSVSAFAVPPSQVARDLSGKTITAKCCVLFGPTVSVTEPAALAPVVVTWSTDYQPNNDEFRFGLSLNGGTCLAYGPEVGPLLLGIPGSAFVSTSYQWVIFPNDGLKKGANTFAVCGGGTTLNNATITIGFNTLAARFSK